MTTKVIDIREVVDLVMPDMKKLQLKLQGSVSAQVIVLNFNLAYILLCLSNNNNDPHDLDCSVFSGLQDIFTKHPLVALFHISVVFPQLSLTQLFISSFPFCYFV